MGCVSELATNAHAPADHFPLIIYVLHVVQNDMKYTQTLPTCISVKDVEFTNEDK